METGIFDIPAPLLALIDMALAGFLPDTVRLIIWGIAATKPSSPDPTQLARPDLHHARGGEQQHGELTAAVTAGLAISLGELRGLGKLVTTQIFDVAEREKPHRRGHAGGSGAVFRSFPDTAPLLPGPGLRFNGCP